MHQRTQDANASRVLHSAGAGAASAIAVATGAVAGASAFVAGADAATVATSACVRSLLIVNMVPVKVVTCNKN